MKSFLALVLMGSVAFAGPGKEPPQKFADFAGPVVKPAVESGVARVVAPIQGSDWHKSLSFYEAKILRVEGNDLVVDGVHGEVFVPGAFVAPPNPGTPLKVGAYVRFQARPGLYTSTSVGRITKVTTGDDGTVYTIKWRFIDEVSVDEVPAAQVRPVDGTLVMGAPVMFEIDGKPCFGEYVAPGREAGSSWVLSAGYATEKTNVKPLVIKPFAKGSKVRAKISTTSVMKGDVQQEPRQYLENATVVQVIDGGLAYKVKRDGGEHKGAVSEVDVDAVFAR